MDGEETIVLKNDLAEIRRLNGVIDSLAEREEWDAKALFEVHLALDELLTNVISYGYEDRAEHSIHLALSVTDGVLRLRLEDDGRPFNPLDCALPDLEAPIEERRVGGLGVFLARRMMDEVEYRRVDGRNVLWMAKRVRKQEGRN